MGAFIYWKNRYQTCEGCGVCQYEKFTDTVKVEKIAFKNDSIDYINFKSTIYPDQKYQEDSRKLSFLIDKEFTEKEIKDTLNTYTISGDRIITGSCTPCNIHKIELVKR